VKNSHPVATFAKVATVLKLLQLWAFVTWYLSENKGPVNFITLEPIRWLIGLPLIIAGQALNYGIYHAIGQDGVYYGVKLGKKVPWYNGFPFNVVAHPQYVGAVFTLWGIAVLISTPAHALGLLQLCVLVTGLYIFTAITEQFF